MKLKWLPSLMLVVTTGTAFAGTSTESTVRKLSIEGFRIGAPASELQARIDRLVATGEWKVKYLDTWESRPNAQGLSGAHTLEINHCGPKPECDFWRNGAIWLYYLPAEHGGKLVSIERRSFNGEVAKFPASQAIKLVQQQIGEPRQSFLTKNDVNGEPPTKHMLFGGKGYIPEGRGSSSTIPGGVSLIIDTFSDRIPVNDGKPYLEALRYVIQDKDGIDKLGALERSTK